ncbi:MAG: excalibur calcium-binding domain-containing protein [Arenimonas sp.]
MNHAHRVLIAAAVALALSPPVTFAHGGGTDANGCHTNHKTGDYHCHRPKGPLVDPTPPTVPPYDNCDEARAAGVTPLHQGDRGYSRKLDRDGDGVACE